MFTVLALNAGCAGLLWCGHRHRVRHRAERCLRSLSHVSPSLLTMSDRAIKTSGGLSAMLDGEPMSTDQWHNLEGDRDPEGRVRWTRACG